MIHVSDNLQSPKTEEKEVSILREDLSEFPLSGRFLSWGT
jgi:hypothetical protein